MSDYLSERSGINTIIMIQKRFIVILGIILTVIIATIFVVTQQNQKNKQIKTVPRAPSVFVDSPPSIITVPDIPGAASFIYTGIQKTIPSTLPTYQYTEDLSSNTLYALGDKVSSRFSVTGSPSAVIDGDYFAYMRNEEYKWFSLSKTKNIVSVSYQRLLTQDATLVVQNDNLSVLSYFSELLTLPQSMALSSLPAGRAPADGVIFLDPSPPTASNYSYGILINGFPLLTRENTLRWASALVDGRGAIRILNYLVPPSITTSWGVSIISLADAVANINSRRGELLWITQTTGEEYGVVPSFGNGELTSFTLVYVYQNNSLVPAYLFEGSGTAKTGEKQIFEALVLASPSSR